MLTIKWHSQPKCRSYLLRDNLQTSQVTPGKSPFKLNHSIESVVDLPTKIRNKTLNGGRAERNEYILLHEFHRLKYICPDKQWGKKAEAVVKEENDEDEKKGGKKGKGKRDKYKGGLVFEPKRGLWDKFILVMDFNSLYPSIIQEYNIDFTTVEPVEDEVSLDRSFGRITDR